LLSLADGTVYSSVVSSSGEYSEWKPVGSLLGKDKKKLKIRWMAATPAALVGVAK
jgi:hypothetical protein